MQVDTYFSMFIGVQLGLCVAYWRESDQWMIRKTKRSAKESLTL